MAEITRKPTARQTEALRTGAADKRGVISPSAGRRTHEGLVARGMGEWVERAKLGVAPFGSPLCVITEAGRAYLAKLDAERARLDEPEVIETPAAERFEPCIMRSPQQAGTHARAYFTGFMVKVGVREDGTARWVHVLECRACGCDNTRGALDGQPCTPEREAEIKALRAITGAPTREGKRAAVRAAQDAQEAAGAPGEREGRQEGQEGAMGAQEGRGARLVERSEERSEFPAADGGRGCVRRTVRHTYSDGTRVRFVLDAYSDGERLARVTRFAADHVEGESLPVRRRAVWWGQGGGGQRFECCGCVSCSRGRGACVKVPTGPAWGVLRPDGRVVGPFARHAEALRYGRNVVRGGTPVPLEPVA